MSTVTFRPAAGADLPRLQEIRRAAFAPVFASFRAILGDALHALVHARADDEQAELLAALVGPGSIWMVEVAEVEGTIAGFVAARVDAASRVGEIGLNAVHPDHAGRGIGTAMYERALARMKRAGMRVATVATGGDPSHEPARRAYAKAGFTVGIPSLWLCRAL